MSEEMTKRVSLLDLVFVFGILVFILGVVGLLCQYHSQVIGWKDSSLAEMTCYVSSGTLNSIHSLTHSSITGKCNGELPVN